MTGVMAVMHREGRIRATNLLFIFWDLIYPLGYLFVFGVGMSRALGLDLPGVGMDYNAFFLAGVLGMASFGIASNTAWSFFMDRDNGIFYEMLTYPLSRAGYLVGKVLFNVVIAAAQGIVTVALAALVLDLPVRFDRLPLLMAAMVVGTAGWFFFYAIFALVIRRNDAFHVDLLLRVPVRQFDVLPHRAVARRVPANRAGQPDHVAGGRVAVCDRRHRRRRVGADGFGGLRGVHAGDVRRRAVGVEKGVGAAREPPRQSHRWNAS